MANEKIMNTRIQLKYDSYDNWLSHSSVILKAGEVAIAYLGPSHTDLPTPEGVNKTHPVLFKVGDGVTTFANLPWASALAADVYAWAKEDKLIVNKDGTGNVVSGIEWDATANGGKGGLKYTTAAVATAEGLGELQEAVADIIEDIENNRAKWEEKTVDTNNNTTYSFTIPTEGDDAGKLVITETPSALGEAGKATTIKLDILTPAEFETAIVNYYTKEEITTLTNGKLHTQAEIETIAAAKINALIEGAESDDTIANITNLVEFVNNNADAVTQLNTDVSTANTNASNALTAANGAVETANTAASNAATALSTANEAKEAAITAQNSATAKADEAAQSAEDAAAAKADAESAKADAETALINATEAKDNAESAKLAAESAAVTAGDEAQNAAQSAQNAATSESNAAGSASTASAQAALASQSAGAAEAAKSAAVTAQSAAEAAQSAAEGAAQTAATAQAGAESARDVAAQHKADAESAKAAALAAQSAAEAARASASGFADDAGRSESNASASADAAAASEAAAKQAQSDAEAAAQNAWEAENSAGGAADLANNYANAASEYAGDAGVAAGAAAEAQAKAEAAQAKAEEAQAAAEASNTSATAIANEAKETANAAKTASETATNNVTTLTNTINGYGDIVTHNVAEFATAEQGELANTAVQSLSILGYNMNQDFNELSIANAQEALGLKSAAYTEASDYATAAQGEKADSALQEITTTANGGLKVTNKNQIDIDTDVTFVFYCGTSSELV